MADVLPANPEVTAASEVDERSKAVADSLRADASLEDPTITTPDTASEHLADITLVDGSESDPVLEAKATALKQFFHSGHWFNNDLLPENDVEFTDVQNVFRTMTPAQLEKFEQVYNNLSDTVDLNTELETRLKSPVQMATIHALMGRTEGETNWAGYISVALEAAGSGDQKGGGELARAIFSTMSEEQIDAARAQWTGEDMLKFGPSLDEAVVGSNLSDTDKALYLSIYKDGVENKSAGDMIAAATTYITSLDSGRNNYRLLPDELRRYGDIIGGDSPEAQQARAALLQSKDFVDAYHRVFNRTPLAEGYLNEGRISIVDVVSQNRTLMAKMMQGEQSEDFVESTLANATNAERNDFIEGRRLAQSGAELTDPDEIRKAQYFADITKTFQECGGEELAAIWADVFAHGGKTLVSEIAQLSIDDKLNQPALMNVIETMSERDWNLLHPADGKETPEMTALLDAVSKFAPEIQDEAAARLRSMAESGSYAEAKAGNQNFEAVMLRNKPNLETGAVPVPADVLHAVMNMSDADRQKYHEDANFRESVNLTAFPDHNAQKQFIDDPVAQAQLLLAQSMLKQIEEDGGAPEMGVVENFAQRMISGGINSSNQLETLETVATDPSVMQMLKDYVPTYNEQMAPANMFEEHIDGYDSYATSLTQLLRGLDPDGHKANYQALLGGAKISEATQIASGLAPTEGFTTLADEAENRYLEGDLRHEVAENVIVRQGGVADPVDIAQMYLLGMNSHANGNEPYDYRDVLTMLDAAGPEGRDQFYRSMEEKYGVDFVAEFTQHVSENENLQGEYKTIFDNAAAQGFNLTTADEVALAVLDDKGGCQEFENTLAAMSFDERDLMKSEYANKGYGDFDSEFLGLVGNGNGELEKYTELVASFEVDPSSKFIQRLLESKDDLSGWDLDGTNEELVRSILTNRDVLAQYAAARESLPPAVLAEIDAMYVDAVNNNRTSKENIAAKVNAAVDGILLVAAAATLLPSGGTSAVAFGSLTAASRAALMDAIKGDGIMTEAQRQDNFNRALVEAGLFVAPDVAVQAFQGVKTLAQSPAFRDLLNATAVRPSESMVAAGVGKFDETVAIGSEPAYVMETADQIMPSTAPVNDVAAMNGGSLESNLASFGDDADDLSAVFRDGLESGPTDPTLTLPRKDVALPEIKSVTPEVDALPVVKSDPVASVSVDDVVPDEAITAGQPLKSADAATPDEALTSEQRIAEDAAEQARLAQLEEARIAAQAEQVRLAKLAEEAEQARILEAARRTAAIDEAALTIRPFIAPAVAIVDSPAPVEEQTDFAPPAPNAELVEMATVRRGEGPWQSAERILAASGGEYGIDEVRALVKAIKAVYAQDNGSDDMSGLKVKYNFVTNDNFDNLIEAVDNPSVEAALRGFTLAG